MKPSAETVTFYGIWAFVIAAFLGVIAGCSPARAHTLSALSADAGSQSWSRPAGLGVARPGISAETRNAVESILSHDLRQPAPSCGFGDKTILQDPATTFARGPAGAADLRFSLSPAFLCSWGAMSCRESNPAAGLSADAAPGEVSLFAIHPSLFLPRRDHA